MTDKRIDYRSSGVDIQAGENAVNNIKQMVRETYNHNVLGDLGSFGGLYRFDTSQYQAPVLVSSTDGVGTKLLVAVLAGRYDTVGQDLVNHCVNDILVQGALPMFFLDYIGLGKLDHSVVQEIIGGMVKACHENQCVLIGGEMAEMPGIYREKDFDLAGTIVGVVEQSSLLPANRIRCGDILVGMPSTGLHTNGYSLARRIVFEHLKLDVGSYVNDLKATVGELLLAVHKSYLQEIKPHLTDRRLHGLAHITGGGIPGNLKRIIPDGLSALVSYNLDEFPPLFRWLGDSADLGIEEMRSAFNLGIGMIAVVDPGFVEDFMRDTNYLVLGEIEESRPGFEKVTFIE
ncbi:MAG TPA: phosphoribosylformylglycinamidine cyclo-ligase [Candidatus Cloacimonadota bacterium]|nr:phosphoribosylformylglycinamidine cyclo-ligase [Candidatus Cloacimonadota bacterium]